MIVVFKLKAPRLVGRLAAWCVETAASVSMPRRLSLAAVGLALSVASTADFAPTPVPPPPQPDPRVSRLERFFRHYNCPAPHYIPEYLRASDGYQLDYRLLPAISLRESGCGVAYRMANNHWGYHPDRQSFPTVEMGIDYVARQLAQGFYYQGKSLEQKLFVYNPRPAYPIEIQRIMRQIE